MDNKSSRDIFQYFLLGTFAVLAGLSVLFLATYKEKVDPTEVVDTSRIVIWGPPMGSHNTMDQALKAISLFDPSLSTVRYVEMNPLTSYRDLTEAIAAGNPPDLVLFEGASLLELRNYLQPISYESLPLRQFRDTYVEGAELFALPDAIYALPIMVDPLVLYWNRDLFTNALVTQVPQDWETFVNVVPRLSIIEQGADLKQSAVAFGEYDNVLHVRYILSALFMQTGTPIVVNEGGDYRSALGATMPGGSDPTLALTFFTDFSNPRKTVYSWNKTFQRSREAFAANQVAMYGGFASEATTLTSINPNLNFDVALWPQSARARTKVTYGQFYGLGVVKSSAHLTRAMKVLSSLSSAQALKEWSSYARVPTVMRSLLGGVPTDPFAEVMARSAIIARSWRAPHAAGQTDEIFAEMVNSLTSGRELPASALARASKDLDTLLDKYDAKR